jgi:hypothetical protein
MHVLIAFLLELKYNLSVKVVFLFPSLFLPGRKKIRTKKKKKEGERSEIASDQS